MIGLYLKIMNAHDTKPSKMRIKEFRLKESSENQEKLGIPVGHWIPILKEPEHKGSKFEFLKCPHCGHHDFSEDGENINDYTCNGCSMTISANERTDKE